MRGLFDLYVKRVENLRADILFGDASDEREALPDAGMPPFAEAEALQALAYLELAEHALRKAGYHWSRGD